MLYNFLVRPNASHADTRNFRVRTPCGERNGKRASDAAEMPTISNIARCFKHPISYWLAAFNSLRARGFRLRTRRRFGISRAEACLLARRIPFYALCYSLGAQIFPSDRRSGRFVAIERYSGAIFL